MSTSVGPALRQAVSWISSFNPTPTGRFDYNCHRTEEEPSACSVHSPGPPAPLAPSLPTASCYCSMAWRAEWGVGKERTGFSCLVPTSSTAALLWPEQCFMRACLPWRIVSRVLWSPHCWEWLALGFPTLAETPPVGCLGHPTGNHL